MSVQWPLRLGVKRCQPRGKCHIATARRPPCHDAAHICKGSSSLICLLHVQQTRLTRPVAKQHFRQSSGKQSRSSKATTESTAEEISSCFCRHQKECALSVCDSGTPSLRQSITELDPAVVLRCSRCAQCSSFSFGFASKTTQCR